MKILKSCFLIFITVLYFFSCEKEIASVEKEESIQFNDPELSVLMIQEIAARGFNPDQIEEFATYFIAEGDVHFDKECLFEEINSDNYFTKQRRSSHLSDADLIWVRIDPSLHPDVKAGIRAGMENWNNISTCRINLVESGKYYDINIYRVYKPGVTWSGLGAFPSSSGKPGATIQMNEARPTAWTRLAMHEIGHNIGFTHTNGTYGTLISGTPTTDPNSIMNNPIGGGSFTHYDKIASYKLYPEPKCLYNSFYNDWLTQPNSGSFTENDDVMPIRWNTSKFSGTNVRLELLYDGARYQWINATSNFSAYDSDGIVLDVVTTNDGEYDWDIPEIAHHVGTEFQIRISDPNSSCTKDVSNSKFRILTD